MEADDVVKVLGIAIGTAETYDEAEGAATQFYNFTPNYEGLDLGLKSVPILYLDFVNGTCVGYNGSSKVLFQGKLTHDVLTFLENKTE